MNKTFKFRNVPIGNIKAELTKVNDTVLQTTPLLSFLRWFNDFLVVLPDKCTQIDLFFQFFFCDSFLAAPCNHT